MEKSNGKKSAKNRDKSAKNRRKIGKERFCQLLSGRAVHARSWRVGPIISPIYRRKSQKIAFYRLIFGVFSANILAPGFLAVSDLTVQISSAFFEKSNGYIFDPTVDFKSEA